MQPTLKAFPTAVKPNSSKKPIKFVFLSSSSPLQAEQIKEAPPKIDLQARKPGMQTPRHRVRSMSGELTSLGERSSPVLVHSTLVALRVQRGTYVSSAHHDPSVSGCLLAQP